MDTVGSLAKSLVSLGGRWLFGWLARYRMLQALALRSYQRQLTKTYGTFSPASRSGAGRLAMREMYLPLLVELGGNRRASIDTVLAMHRRVLVTGEPGTGKSMLLRHLAFEFGDGGAAARRGKIPVSIELKRKQVAEAELDRYVVGQLSREGFLRADKFVQRALRGGTLRLLLDGLDEVPQGEPRTIVAQPIEEFLVRHPDCEVIVTCRAAVRESALLAELTEVAMAELDNQLIREYVRRRLGISNASVESLLGELFANPRVLALARIPLLLDTMINIYGRGARPAHNRFPASRAQFYQQAVEFLLTPQHVERAENPDRIDDTRQVLRRLALISLADPGDLTIDRDRAVTEAGTLLQADRSAARELLAEIVERSGLLHRTEDGYRFAHLSFQEFLAAEALRRDGTELLRRFRADPDRWLEPVVLWCGIVEDATDVVAGLLSDSSLTALECLSEAGNVSAETVNRIVERFGPDLPHLDVVRAFGLAGSGHPDIAGPVAKFLEREFTETTNPARRSAAADALAASNLPRAVEFLRASYDTSPPARAALERMRDSAVDVLAGMARADDLTPLDGLLTIGTPAAGHALVDLLWHRDEGLAAGAAWRLGALLSDERVVISLSDYRLAAGQRAEPKYLWVTEPFDPSPASQVIVSRICQLLKHGPESAVPSKDRLRLPDWLAISLGLVGAGPLHVDDAALDGVVVDPMRHLRLPDRERVLLSHASDRALATVLGDRPRTAPTERDWRRMFAKYPEWLTELAPLAFVLISAEALVATGLASRGRSRHRSSGRSPGSAMLPGSWRRSGT